jgi:alkylation response protein AidB-like acyl-CoA dehydrogenase
LLRALAAAAADSDRWGVPRSAIDALARSGLLGRPLESPPLARELAERLFMADGSLTFCWLQHQMPLRRLDHAVATPEAPAAVDLRQRWLDSVASGRALAAVAFAHLRRPGPPNPVATRVSGGWVLEGELDWITSWDIADLALICVRCADSSGDRVVGVVLPAGASGEPLPSGFSLGDPLRLLAMGGTHTRPARLDGVRVPERMVLFVEPFSAWSAADAIGVCRVSPIVFGCMRGAIADLHAVATARGDQTALALAQTLAQEGQQVRRNAYALLDDPGGSSPKGQRRHRLLRSQALDLAMRCAQAAVVARAGAAMRTGTASERRLREATFLLVQAQTADSRQASLELLAGRAWRERVWP